MSEIVAKKFQNYFMGIFKTMDEIDTGYMGEFQYTDISHKKTQERIKFYYQSFVEEVSELYDTILNPREDTGEMVDEVADCMGFITIMAIRSGFNENIIDMDNLVGEVETMDDGSKIDHSNKLFTKRGDTYAYAGNVGPLAMDIERVRALLFEPIYLLGMACNMLKNRAWKKEEYVVDYERYHSIFKEGINCFYENLITLGFSFKDFQDGFERKKEINLKRIRENY